MKRCMLAAISIQGKESISLNLTTLTHYGDQKQFITESIILDKMLSRCRRLGQCRRIVVWNFHQAYLDLLTLLPCLMYLYGLCVYVRARVLVFDTGSWAFFCNSLLMQLVGLQFPQSFLVTWFFART